jgi:hypothetical protein
MVLVSQSEGDSTNSMLWWRCVCCINVFIFGRDGCCQQCCRKGVGFLDLSCRRNCNGNLFPAFWRIYAGGTICARSLDECVGRVCFLRNEQHATGRIGADVLSALQLLKPGNARLIQANPCAKKSTQCHGFIYLAVPANITPARVSEMAVLASCPESTATQVTFGSGKELYKKPQEARSLRKFTGRSHARLVALVEAGITLNGI